MLIKILILFTALAFAEGINYNQDPILFPPDNHHLLHIMSSYALTFSGAMLCKKFKSETGMSNLECSLIPATLVLLGGILEETVKDTDVNSRGDLLGNSIGVTLGFCISLPF